MSRDEQLTAESLVEMAVRLMVVRVWRHWKDEEQLNIDLVTFPQSPPRGLNGLYRFRYTAELLPKSSNLFGGTASVRLDRLIEGQGPEAWKPGAQEVLDSWKECAPELLVGLSAFACYISTETGRIHTTEWPVGRLQFLFHYIRLRTMMEMKYGDILDQVPEPLQRFDKFIERRIEELAQLRKMLEMD